MRAIQAQLKTAGVDLITEADPTSTGPDHITLADPDGNTILVDQHVP